MQQLTRLIEVEGTSPADARRRRLLSILLLASGSIAAALLFVVLIVRGTRDPLAEWEMRVLIIGCVSVCIGVAALYFLNRHISGELAGIAFVALLIAAIVVSDEPSEIVNGRSFFAFAIPVLSASFVIRPWASFGAAGLSSLIIVALSVGLGEPVPNYVGSLSLFLLAVVPYLAAAGTERALRNAHTANIALQESQNRYRGLIDSSPSGVALHEILTDAAGQPMNYVLLEANAAFETVTGLRTDDMVGRSVNDFIPVEEAPLDIYGRVALTGEAVRFEHYFASLDKTFDVSAYSPRPRQFAVVVTDISDRIRAQRERERLLAEIQEQARRVEQIIKTVPAGVILLSESGLVRVANLLGEQYLAELGELADDAALSRFGARPLRDFLRSSSGMLWHEIERDGRYFEVHARPIATDVAGGEWVMMVRDVTKERAMQQHVQEQERLAAVGQLAGGVAHDFNNYLTAIMLSAQLPLAKPDLPLTLRQSLETILDESRRAANLVQQILDFSRRSPIKMSPVDVQDVIRGRVRVLRKTLPDHVRLEFTTDERDHTVYADPTRIEQVVLNLATNARDAMPRGGLLRIDLKKICVTDIAQDGPPEPGDWVRIAVSDTGEGVPPNVLPHIFEPFFTTKAPGKGSGLGLAQVYGIVKQHRGHIVVSSDVGVGTVFNLYLPAGA